MDYKIENFLSNSEVNTVCAFYDRLPYSDEYSSGSNRRKGCGEHHHQELRARQINAVNLRNKDGRNALHNGRPIHIDGRPQRHRKSGNALINTQTFFNRSQCHG